MKQALRGGGSLRCLFLFMLGLLNARQGLLLTRLAREDRIARVIARIDKEIVSPSWRVEALKGAH